MEVWNAKGVRIKLRQQAFVASGGQAHVYTVGDQAFKIFREPSAVPAAAKFTQLAKLSNTLIACQRASFITPGGLVYGADKRPLGYQMPFVPNARALCELFPPAFKRRFGLAARALAGLVETLRCAVAHAHAAKVIIVDLNGMNVLLSENLQDLYLIDTDSYQTPTFSATALDPAVRDWHAADGHFTPATDWFSFAVLACQIFLGIHPYRGKHPKVHGLEARMRANLSVFSPAVQVPPACAAFDTIPKHMRDWLEAVLDKGERLAPPTISASDGKRSGATRQQHRSVSPAATAKLQLSVLGSADSAILEYAERPGWQVIVSENGIQVNARRIARPVSTEALVAWATPDVKPVLVWAANGQLHAYDLEHETLIPCQMSAQEICVQHGELYVRAGPTVTRISLRTLNGRTLATVGSTAVNVLPHASRLFPGCVWQCLLGTTVFTLLEANGASRQVRLPSLDGLAISYASYDNGVLIALIQTRSVTCEFSARFDANGDYDELWIDDIEPDLPDFLTLASGTVIQRRSDATLALYSNQPGCKLHRLVTDSRLLGAARLCHGTDGVVILLDRQAVRLTLGA